MAGGSATAVVQKVWEEPLIRWLILVVIWILGVRLGLKPLHDSSLLQVLFVCVAVLVCCASAFVLARLLPAVTSWSDLGLRRSSPLRGWAGVAVLLAGALSYIAAAVIAQDVARRVVSAIGPGPGRYSAAADPNAGQVPVDLIRAVKAGMGEELLWFGLPVVLGAVYWRQIGLMHGPGVRRKVLRALVVVAAAVVAGGIRFYAHLNWQAEVIAVVPWLVGSLLILRLCGTLWPLVLGHIVFNIITLTLLRTDLIWLDTTFQVLIFLGTITLLALCAAFSRAIWPSN